MASAIVCKPWITSALTWIAAPRWRAERRQQTSLPPVSASGCRAKAACRNPVFTLLNDATAVRRSPTTEAFMRALLILIPALLLAWPAQAVQMVEAIGSAPVQGAISHVRSQTLKDAMHQASLRASAKVRSTALLSKGVMAQADVEVGSTG